MEKMWIILKTEETQRDDVESHGNHGHD
jgi:hypothetical protein